MLCRYYPFKAKKERQIHYGKEDFPGGAYNHAYACEMIELFYRLIAIANVSPIQGSLRAFIACN